MTSLLRALPELYRSSLVECPPARLALGAATMLVLGGVYAFADGLSPGEVLFHWTFVTQAAVLVIYGSVRVSASVSDEREAKTWDLQRLTPLGSAEIAAGKLMGAPSFAAFLAALMLPWAVVGAARAERLEVGVVPMMYFQLAATAFFAWSTSLCASAYSDLGKGGSSTTAGGMIGFFSVYALFPAFGDKALAQTIKHLGVTWPLVAWMPLATAVFGVWAFLAAKWRLGQDLLEPPRIWRLPGFALYLIVFFAAFDTTVPQLAVLPACAAVWLAALSSAPKSEVWRRWLAADGAERLHRTPAWIAGAAVCVAAAIFLTLLPSPPGHEVYRRVPLIAALWLVRDAAFMQACRFTRSRRPEMLAAVFLGLSYFVPMVVVAVTKSPNAAYWFAPFPETDVGPVANVVPAVLWAAGALAALATVSRRDRSL